MKTIHESIPHHSFPIHSDKPQNKTDVVVSPAIHCESAAEHTTDIHQKKTILILEWFLQSLMNQDNKSEITNRCTRSRSYE